MRTILCFAISLSLVSSAFANVGLPRIFGSNMVLQRDAAAPVWGWAEPGEQVTVTFAGQTKKASADNSGSWMVKLDAMEASNDGRDLVVSGKNKLTFKNVLVGEVWVCSGQSNMEWTVGGALQPNVERENAKFPLIRHIKVNKVPSDAPQKDFGGTPWTVCSPQTVNGYTAVGYFFGRRLHQELEIPVGLINTSWGGTRIEPWVPLVGFRKIKDVGFAKQIISTIERADPSTGPGKQAYKEGIASIRKWLDETETRVESGQYPTTMPAKFPSLGRSHQSPSRLYRGMVHPLVPFGIRGAIWYQGESNGNEGITYTQKKQALVEGWRQVWGQGDFPFYWVQLANFTDDRKTPEGGDGYARVRDAQRKAMAIKNTGMAVIIDIGETRDIHPKNKQDVGSRLAQWALARDYGKDVVPCGPLYKSHKVEGNAIRVSFDHVGGGLIVGIKSGLEPVTDVKDLPLQRFAIAGKDRKWVWAKAKIDGGSVVVSSQEVANPVAVRYAYSANPLGANLYNAEGIPASPFRTDDW